MKLAIISLLVTFESFTQAHSWGHDLKVTLNKSNADFDKSGLYEKYIVGHLGTGKYLSGDEVH
jgi:hypothetical protein